MTPYLLDTNVISDFVRNPQGRVATRIKEVGIEKVCTSIIVAAELRFGLAKGVNSPITRSRVRDLLETMEVLSFDAPADIAYGALRARLEKAGTPISANDMLIAAHAMALGCTLVTDNEREFARVEGLTCENWLRRS